MHAWLASYLANRSQQVYIHGKLSTVKLIDAGVPLGSNLEPLFFNIYVNKLFLNITAKLIMYADDMTLIISGKSRADEISEKVLRYFCTSILFPKFFCTSIPCACGTTAVFSVYLQASVGFTQCQLDLVSGHWLIGYMIRQDMVVTILHSS